MDQASLLLPNLFMLTRSSLLKIKKLLITDTQEVIHSRSTDVLKSPPLFLDSFKTTTKKVIERSTRLVIYMAAICIQHNVTHITR